MKKLQFDSRAMAPLRLLVAATLFFCALAFAGIAFSQFKMKTAKAPDAVDPDMRPGAGEESELEGGEYLAKREAFIALLRGFDPAKPFDPAARSSGECVDGSANDRIAKRAARRSRHRLYGHHPCLGRARAKPHPAWPNPDHPRER